MLAFRRTVRLRGIPRHLFDDLLDGMAMDLDISRYPDFAALDLYCYRVAGVVGLMMTHVLGFTSDRCIPNALALGTAMQLTNILRDVAEDWTRWAGSTSRRTNWPDFGVTEGDLAAGRLNDPLPQLDPVPDRPRPAVLCRGRGGHPLARRRLRPPDRPGDGPRLRGHPRGDRAAGLDVFRARARVSTPRKLATLAGCQLDTSRDAWRRFWG